MHPILASILLGVFFGAVIACVMPIAEFLASKVPPNRGLLKGTVELVAFGALLIGTLWLYADHFAQFTKGHEVWYWSAFFASTMATTRVIRRLQAGRLP
jgi:hypothetical protein